MSDVTRILSQIEEGDPQAAEQLLPLVYDELRKLATIKLASEKTGQTLQATALVHEAYMRLVGDQNPQPWDGRGHFFSAAAEAMRRILVEAARKKQRLKHGGQHDRLTLSDHPAPMPDDNLIALDDALTQLAAEDPEAAQVVKLRYFAGLTIEQTAEALQLSVRTVNRHWAYARARLYEQLS
jgi:RNA polymerase sigma factor (TIGR02999 family)